MEQCIFDSNVAGGEYGTTTTLVLPAGTTIIRKSAVFNKTCAARVYRTTIMLRIIVIKPAVSDNVIRVTDIDSPTGFVRRVSVAMAAFNLKTINNVLAVVCGRTKMNNIIVVRVVFNSIAILVT